MKHLGSWFLLLATALPVLAEGPTLADARRRWLKGNYQEAVEQYETLLRDKQHQAAAAVGLSRALQSLGEYDRALTVLEDAIKAGAADAALDARMAELLHLRGRWDEADRAVARALERDKDQFLAHWVRACLLRDRGKMQEADNECRWFVRTYSQRSNADMDIKDADTLLLVGQAGVENARWHNLADQFQFILTEVYGDALKYDKDLWQAEYLAGSLLLEKYNRGEALDAFDKALTLNPSAAEALVGKGVAALQRLEIPEAEKFAEDALKINPRLPEALRLRADVHLAGGDRAAALKELEAALKISPRDEMLLGRVAAIHHLERRKEAFDKVVAEVEKFDEKPAVFYAEVAGYLEDRRWFDDAEAYFKKAVELRPMLPGSGNSLGMLYMRLGREKEAQQLLSRGFQADPFNVRVSNMLKVLRHLEKYQTLRTEHFEIRYDAENDPALARVMGEYLEAIYADLSEQFGFQASPPILIEVFNNHEMFSGRTIALPDLHTIGACTGKMIAMASPHGRGIRKPFNWLRVLRHELVHIFNLEQTHYLVPHWFTEGLAVRNERFPRPQTWNQLLLERVPAGELMTLDTVDLGFIKPKTRADWHMAYCQSQMYVDYMQKTYGPKSIGGMLDAYKEGLDTEAALKKVCKVEKAEFEKGYRAYVEEIVKGIRARPPEKAMSLKELREAYDAKPGDPDLGARLAEMLMGRDRVEARKLVEAVLAKRKDHPLACYVKAKLLTLGGDVEAARELLEIAAAADDVDPKILGELAHLYYDSKDFKRAAELCEKARKLDPLDNQWLMELTRIYAQLGDRDRQIEVLKDLVPTDADDFDNRKRLAQLLMEANRPADAERYAREALEIDIRDEETRALLLEALRAQKRDAEAEKFKKLLEG